MKLIKIATCALVLLATVSCSKDNKTMTGKGNAAFSIASNENIGVVTKSNVSDYTTLPSSGDFTITIAGSGIDYSWTGLVSEWDATTPLAVGNYTVSAAYGAEGVEGFDKPYFAGETTFSVVGAQTANVEIPVALGNSIVKVQTSQVFDNYFTTYTFTVTTGNKTEIAFPKGETRAAFVDAYRFTISGVLTNQSGKEQSFIKEFTGLEAKTCYAVTFDAPNIGAGTIAITFNDTTTEVALGEVELNE